MNFDETCAEQINSGDAKSRAADLNVMLSPSNHLFWVITKAKDFDKESRGPTYFGGLHLPDF